MSNGISLDPETAAYFDGHVPEWGVERLSHAADFIVKHGAPESSLIDVGAGTGNTLLFLRERTGLANLTAIDVSENCLRILKGRVDCEVHHRSILDPDFVQEIGESFDFAVVGSVLHHLIGSSRRQSIQYASRAVAHATALLKPGGFLIINEPVFSPPIAMSAVFYVKKAVTRITDRRVSLFGYDSNIGAPVVSYYTAEQVREMASSGTNRIVASIVDDEDDPDADHSPGQERNGIRERIDDKLWSLLSGQSVTVIAQKEA